MKGPVTTLLVLHLSILQSQTVDAFDCSLKTDGNYADPADCSGFITCAHGIAYSFDCPSGLMYNAPLNICDWPRNVDCDLGNPPAPTVPSTTLMFTTATDSPAEDGSTEATVSTASPASTHGSAEDPFDCSLKEDGNYADPADCSGFITCAHGIAYSIACPSGLMYNAPLNICDWPRNVDCRLGHPPAPAVPSTTLTFTAATDSPADDDTPPGSTGTTASSAAPSSTHGSAEDPFDCSLKDDGNYADPTDCSRFITCAHGIAYSFDCPSGLMYNAPLNICDWPRNVDCDLGNPPAPTVPSTTLTFTTATDNPAEGETPPRSTEATASTSAPASTHESAEGPFDCSLKEDGNYADPTDCSRFITCAHGIAYSIDCPSGLMYNAPLNICDWPRNVDCDLGHPPAEGETPPRSTEATTSTSAPASTHESAGGVFDCSLKEDGNYADPTDCSRFITCAHGIAYSIDCPSGLMYNAPLNICDWPRNVDCDLGHPPAPTVPSTTLMFTTATDSPAEDGSTEATVSTAAPASTHGSAGCSRRVCYHTNWSQYRPGSGRFLPENIDPFLCTHLVYAFAQLNGNNLVTFEWNDENLYHRVNNLKKTNPNLKTLLSVGGWNMGSALFTAMVATHASRQQFADQSVQFLRSRGFDGLDLNWEYPANRGSPPEDKGRFTILVKQLRETYDGEAARTGLKPLLVTAAVAAGKSTIDSAYEIPEISKYLDFISLISYDLHGSWETVTGHHSGLYPHSTDSGNRRHLNVDWAARYWVDGGCPKDKLVIGVPTYARTFKLSSSNTGVGAPASGPGSAGAFTHEAGFLAYYEVCGMRGTADVQETMDDQKVSYLVKGDQWVGYEDSDSLKEKVRYVKNNGYGGVMTWALDLDDFSGTFCNEGRYPLWSAVNSECLK